MTSNQEREWQNVARPVVTHVYVIRTSAKRVGRAQKDAPVEGLRDSRVGDWFLILHFNLTSCAPLFCTCCSKRLSVSIGDLYPTGSGLDGKFPDLLSSGGGLA